MKKTTASFVCQECGYDSPKFLGKCPECGNWNSFKEITISTNSKTRGGSLAAASVIPKRLDEVKSERNQRILSGFKEMDTVFGGGIVSGSVTLLAGDPGIGKSTLLLQAGLSVALTKPVLYVSGEESEEQVKLRAERLLLGKTANKLLLASSNSTDAIVKAIEETKPALVIIDSVQTMESDNAGGLAGSVGQIRYATSMFIRAAKTFKIPLILVGHVTKEGMVAGPMLLSHMVDVVLFLEGEKNTGTRILRGIKNRFGPVDEVGIFTMEEHGMVDVSNAEQIFLSEIDENATGSVLVSTLEGTRAFLVELQGLTVMSKLPIPRRVASGIDTKRLELLLAVMQKHGRLPIAGMDVFVNVAGGIRLTDAACDLGVCLALYASMKNIRLPKTVAIAEVGLLGELRVASNLDKRIKEAEKLGMKTIISAKTHKTIADVIQFVSK